MPVFPGRYTAQSDEPFVVFLIGLRVNRLFAFNKWIPIARLMGPMIAELSKQPDSGFLHAETMLYWRGVALVQYWRSFEHLNAYAHHKGGLHLTAWAEFNRRVGNNGAVGIWHETFMVHAGQSEVIYVNMPRFGFAAAANHIPVKGRLDSARSRMNLAQRDEPTLTDEIQHG